MEYVVGLKNAMVTVFNRFGLAALVTVPALMVAEPVLLSAAEV